MSAYQEQELLHFGSARLFGQDQNGNTLDYGQLNDISVDMKTELKEAFGEGNYAFDVADSHRSIDISAKHYLMDANGLASSLGGTNASNTVGYVFDEAGTVPGVSTYHVTLANTNVLSILDVVGLITVGSVQAPVHYKQVGSGTEVAGQSYSVAANVLQFAAGDANVAVQVTYSYTLAANAGTVTTVSSTYQNSQPYLSMVALKRDRSKVDGSTRIFAYEFAAVRDGGIKSGYKEGDYTIYERTFKAFANAAGLVMKVRQVNI